MGAFLKMLGWCFTVFYLYQASLNLAEYFSPRSVMPCVTRILDAYILWFIFPMSLIMAGIIISDVRSLLKGCLTGGPRKVVAARVILGSAGVAAACTAAVRIVTSC